MVDLSTESGIIRHYLMNADDKYEKIRLIECISELTLRPISEIADILERAGLDVPERVRGAHRNFSKNELIDMYWEVMRLREQGVTISQYAESIGLSKHVVAGRLQMCRRKYGEEIKANYRRDK